MEKTTFTVRKTEENDWSDIREIWLDFENSEYVYYDTYKETEPESVKERIKKWDAANRSGKNDHLFFSVCLSGEVIGFVSANRCLKGYDIGYGFKKKYQGMGYGKKGISEVISILKTYGAESIYAGTAIKNAPSFNLLLSLGFSLRATELLSFHKDKYGNDIVFQGGIFELEL